MHGLTVNEILVEEGVSGSIPVEERPVGGALFARLQKGDIVIAAKLDRLFRSALDALKVVENLKGRGVKLHLLDLAGNALSKLFLPALLGPALKTTHHHRARTSQRSPVHTYAFGSADAAVQSARQALASLIEILERERDRLITLVVEGLPHLRSLRLRQLKSIERMLVAVQAERAKLPLELHQ